MTVLWAGEAVDHFVDSAVAPASDDQLAAVCASATRNLGGFTGASRFREVSLDAAGAEDPPRLVKLCTACRATAAGVGIVDQQRVAQIFHRSL
jgi:hypothetical protein